MSAQILTNAVPPWSDTGMFYVYGLADPRDFHVGHLGISADPLEEYRALRTVQLEDVAERLWLRQLRLAEAEPVLIVLASVRTRTAAEDSRDTWTKTLRARAKIGPRVSVRRHGRHGLDGPRRRRAPAKGLGKKLAEARVARNLTQQQLGDAIGRSMSAVSKWESGARQIPRPAIMALRALDIDLEAPARRPEK
jgi:DNA-binding XRE family transcriptional regulator